MNNQQEQKLTQLLDSCKLYLKLSKTIEQNPPLPKQLERIKTIAQLANKAKQEGLAQNKSLREQGGTTVTDEQPPLLEDGEGNLVYTSTGEFSKQNFPWKRQEDGTWIRNVVEVEKVYYYTNKGKQIYTQKPIKKFKETAPNTKVPNSIGNMIDSPNMNKLSIVSGSEQPVDKDETWNCHGNTFVEGETWFNNEAAGGIRKVLNDDKWQFVEEISVNDNPRIAKAGDAALFKDNSGEIIHSATYNGDGTFTSKNGQQTLKPKTTLAELIAVYDKTKKIDFQRRGDENKVLEKLDTNDGSANYYDIQTALKDEKNEEKNARKKAKLAEKERKKAERLKAKQEKKAERERKKQEKIAAREKKN